MTAETHKRNHHHHHHHHSHHHQHVHSKKIVHLRSVERITNLPVVESAHAYYEKIKKTNPLIKWSLMPAEAGVWLAVGTAMPVVSYFEKPVSAVDSIFCKGLDVIEANLPVVTYPPELMFNITKDYVNSKVVTPMLKRADSVKQIGISGANICGELAADRLNNAIDVADKYVDKYLPDIADGTDSPADVSEETNYKNQAEPINRTVCMSKILKIIKKKLKEKDNERKINRLHVYSDSHGKLLADKLKKKCAIYTEIYVCVNTGATSSYIASNAIKGIKDFTKSDAIVLIAGMDDVAVGRDEDKIFKEYLQNIDKISFMSHSTNLLVCPIITQYDLPLNGTVNTNIIRINNQLKQNMKRKKHVSILDISLIQRSHFTKGGLYLNSQGKDILASTIASSVMKLTQRCNGNFF